MKKITSSLILLLTLCSTYLVGQTTLLSESFETDGNGTRYNTSTPEFSDGFGDFFTRTDGTNIGSFYEVIDADNNFYFAAQDINGEGANSTQTLTFEDVDISNFESLVFSILLAEDDEGTNQDWDDSDSFLVEYKIDEGEFQNLLAVAEIDNGSAFNQEPGIDSDFDGEADGPPITSTFSSFSRPILGEGLTLDIRITFSLDAGDEDIAIDLIEVVGDPVVMQTPLISEFQPNPAGGDPATTTVELSGAPGDIFNGVLVSLESDPGGSNPGDVNSFESVSGTFDTNGLLIVTINDLENPSFTLVLLDSFSGDVDTDIDTDDDGLVDDITTFGMVLDAVGITDTSSAAEPLYADELGGTNIAFTGAEPELVFRNASTGDLFAVNTLDPIGGQAVFNASGTNVTSAIFNIDPSLGTTFGTINPEVGGAIPNGIGIVATNAVGVEGDSGSSELTFTLSRTGDTSFATSVDYTVSGDVDAMDFGGSSLTGTIAFAADDTEEVLTLLVSGDTDEEANEMFTVTLSNPVNGETLDPSFAEGTIQDDDADVTLTSISAIQGSGTASPLVGNTVTIEGVVTGDFQDGDADTSKNLRGFYVQEEDADADGNPLTSEGIFVFEGGDTTTDINEGDVVQVTGTVVEFFGETQLGTITSIIVNGTGTIPPTQVVLPLNTVANSDGDLIVNLEAYEGMLVVFDQSLTVDEYFNYDRFGDLRLTQGPRPFQFTQTNVPDVTGFGTQQQDLAGRRIALDDGLSIQNPDPLVFPSPAFSDSNNFRGGDTVTGLTGNVRFSRGSGGSGEEIYRIVPTIDPNFVSVNARPNSPENVGGSLKVASLNVLNYFTTLDDGSTTAIGAGPRGANNSTEFDRQTAKLVKAISDINADVLGLVEIENDFLAGSSGNAIENLVNELNLVLGAGTYEWVDPGMQFVGGDAIAVGFIYKTTSISLLGNPAFLNTSAFLDPNGSGQDRNRVAIAQSFVETATNGVFTATVNHFKSKGRSGGTLPSADADMGDGQAFWADTRAKAATELANWLLGDPTNSGDADFMILGDLNAYAEETAITNLEDAGFTDLAQANIAEPYSFLFDGQLGTLDYALTNSSLTTQITGATEWHVNADEPDALDYNLDFGRNPSLFNASNAFRNSDHDPVIVGLGLTPSTSGTDFDLLVTEIWPGQSGTDLTADWFELFNAGTEAWVSATDADLFYEDDNFNLDQLVPILGIIAIQPGESVIVVVGNAADATEFFNVWSPDYDLTNIQIGYADGSGLGGGGDTVNIFLGQPSEVTEAITSGSYPDTEFNDGQSYDLVNVGFSIDGEGEEAPGTNVAVGTTALGGNESDTPAVGSPGNQGPLVVSEDAPIILVDLANLTPFLNLNEENSGMASGVIDDPTDPAATLGIPFVLSDMDTPLNDLLVTVTSNDQTVVTDGNLNFTGTDGSRLLTIDPVGVGFANITITVTDPDANTDTYTINYAASAASVTSDTSRFHTGASDGSTAIPAGTDYMWVGDDEDQTIRLYDCNNSGLPLAEFNFNSALGSSEEVDIEGSFISGNTIFWMGSTANADRSVIFTTEQTNTGADATLSFGNSYTSLRDDLIAWDANNNHGFGANFFQLASSFEIEALSLAPNSTNTAYLGFRNPVSGGNALVVPVTNFTSLPGEPNGSATFGTPILLDLRGRSLRSMECNENGCVLIGGPVGTVTDFKLYTWTGNSGDEAELRSADLTALTTGGSFEGIVNLPTTTFLGTDGDTDTIKLLSDLGTLNIYEDGVENKDQPVVLRKFRTDLVTLGTVAIPVNNDPLINEFVFDHTGGDSEAFIELFGDPNTDYSDFTLLEIEGDAGSSTGAIDASITLGTTDGNGFIVDDEDAENGTVTLLLVEGFTGATGNDIDTNDDGTIDNAPWTRIVDAVASSDGGEGDQVYGIDLAPNFDGNTFQVGGASRIPNGTDTDNTSDWVRNDFDGAGIPSLDPGSPEVGEAFNTPGATNSLVPEPGPDLQITEIWPGNNAGENLTEDWFEITNRGTVAWTPELGDLFFDDDSQDASTADLINGISSIEPGESIIAIDAADTENFIAVWGAVYDLSGVQIGTYNGSGLSQGGDGVTLFLGGPATETIVDFETYPASPAGASYDVDKAGFSIVGELPFEPVATAPNDAGESAVGSPGNQGPLAPMDTTPPIIMLLGDNPITLTQGDSFTDPGATALDNVDGDISEAIQVGGDIVDTNVVDTYTITYNVMDAAMNPAIEVTRTVIVEAVVPTELAIISFNLIDADNDVVLRTIVDGDEINVNDLPTMNLNIEAVATNDVESVRLELTGPQSNRRTENFAPYALFGDINSNYFGNVFPLGDYGLTAIPYSGNSLRGTMGMALAISLSFVDEDSLCEGFVAVLEEPFKGPSTCGGNDGSLTVTVIGGKMPFSYQWSDGQQNPTASNLAAGDYTVTVTDANGCSKLLLATLENPKLPEVTLTPFDQVTDFDEAFALTGGSPSGGVYSGAGVTEGLFDPSIGAGSYEITYSFTDPITNCTNSATQSLTVLSSTSNNSILEFVLVDADTNKDIGPITQGTVLDFATLPNNLSIRAEATEDVESVFLEITGGITASRRENFVPYALFGDIQGNYFGGTFAPGNFTVSATPYTRNNLNGEMGSTLSISFSIGGSQAIINPIDLSIYPNPTTSSVVASFEEKVTVDRIHVFDVQGRLIRTYDAKRVKDGQGYRLDVNDMPAGSYFIRTQDNKGFNYQKQLVIER